MKAIWGKNIREKLNHTIAFVYKTTPQKKETMKIAAASLYRFFVNGDLVGYGPARAPHGYARVDEYDLSDYAGKPVVLAVEVFAANVNTYYIIDQLPFFACEITCDGIIVAQATDFDAYLMTDRVTASQRFSFQRAFVESYRMDQCRQFFYHGDLSLFPRVETEEVELPSLLARHVSYPALNILAYQSMIESGTVTVDEQKPKWKNHIIQGIQDSYKGYPYEQLEECLSDEISQFSYFASSVTPTRSMAQGRYTAFDFGRTVTGFPYLELTIEKDAVVYLTFDELVTKTDECTLISPLRDNCVNVIKYSLKAGEYKLIAFEASSMRFVNVIFLQGKGQIRRFGLVAYENPDVMDSAFETVDEDVDLIVSAARNTLAQNSVDILTDCPSRERAGWLCDSFFSGRAEFFFTGKNKAEKSFLENYILSPQFSYLPKGMLPMCYPADHPNGVYIPNWAMWFVLELQSHINRSGDMEMKRLAKDRVYNLLRFFERFLNEDGLLENFESWVFVEWSKCNDPEHIRGVNYPSNMLYSAVLKAAGELYDDNNLLTQSERIKQTIRHLAYNGQFFEDNAIRVDGALTNQGNLTETCQYYAFYFEIATKQEYPELFATLMDEFGPNRDVEVTYPQVAPSNAFIGNVLRFELMLKHEMYDQVLRESKTYYLPMAKRTGTLWEHSAPSCSLNHGFASIVAYYVLRSLHYTDKEI